MLFLEILMPIKSLSTSLALSLMLLSSMTACTPSPLNAPGVSNAQSSTLQINNDDDRLRKRIVRKSEPVAVTPSRFSIQQNMTAPALKLVAEVAPPLVGDVQVQATNVHIEGNLAYVSYDIAGDEFSGGAYIIDISNPQQPVLLSEVTLKDTDYYSLTKSGNQLFLSGASLRDTLKSRAMVQAVQLSADGRQFVSDNGLVDIPSFAATDIAADGQSLYVTTGAQNGGVAKVNAANLTQDAFYPLEDARSVSLDYQENGVSRVTAFRGTSGELHILDTNLEPVRTQAFPGTATIPFSKSTVEIQNDLALIGAGDGGALSVKLSDLSTAATLKAPSGLTNGASLNGSLAFMAEGEDGVSMAAVDASGSLQKLGSFRFENSASANMVAYQNKVLFVANGRGGLSILTVDETTPAPVAGGIQAVYLRWLQAAGNTGGSRVAGQFKLNGPGRIVGVVSNPKDGATNLTETDFFAAQIDPALPGLLQNTPGSRQRTLEKGDVFAVTDDKTLDFDFFLGNPGGSDDIRILIDHGETVGDNDFTVTLKQPPSTEPGIIVGTDHQEDLSRTMPLSTRADGPIGESTYTVRPEGHDLIVHREAMVPRSQVPDRFFNVDLPKSVATPEPTPAPTATPDPVTTPAPVATPTPAATPQPGPCEGTAANLVVNGGFELPVVGNNYAFVPELTCWTLVKPNKAELDPPSVWAPAEGRQSLDLNPDQPGEIYQEISTVAGEAYTVSFQMAGNISNKGVKTLEVFWGDHSLGIHSFDTTGKTKTNMGWKTVNAE